MSRPALASPLRQAARVLALLAALAAPALPAAAQGVPEPLRGAWFAGDCADPSAMLALTGRAAARVEAEAPARLFRFRDTREAAGFTLGTGTGADAPRLMLRGSAEGLETIEPDAKTRDDRLPARHGLPPGGAATPRRRRWPRCTGRGSPSSARSSSWRRPAAPARPAPAPRRCCARAM
jgi:hypothetical protein